MGLIVIVVEMSLVVVVVVVVVTIVRRVVSECLLMGMEWTLMMLKVRMWMSRCRSYVVVLFGRDRMKRGKRLMLVFVAPSGCVVVLEVVLVRALVVLVEVRCFACSHVVLL